MKYTCVQCRKEFNSTWSDEEARDELREKFGDVEGEALVTVCDDCYKMMTAHLHI